MAQRLQQVVADEPKVLQGGWVWEGGLATRACNRGGRRSNVSMQRQHATGQVLRAVWVWGEGSGRGGVGGQGRGTGSDGEQRRQAAAPRMQQRVTPRLGLGVLGDATGCARCTSRTRAKQQLWGLTASMEALSRPSDSSGSCSHTNCGR